MELKKYWRAVLGQKAREIRGFFDEAAYVCWHNTSEKFDVEGFIRANCEYPGDWDGEIERTERYGESLVSVVHVYTRDKKSSFHVVSFMRLKADKIVALDEYWGDDGEPPNWRNALNPGRGN